MINDVTFTYFGKKYCSCGAQPVVVKQNLRRLKSYNDADMEVKLVVFDEDAKRYIAEFIIPHEQVLLMYDQTQYVSFIKRKFIPIELLNDENVFNMTEIESEYIYIPHRDIKVDSDAVAIEL